MHKSKQVNNKCEQLVGIQNLLVCKAFLMMANELIMPTHNCIGMRGITRRKSSHGQSPFCNFPTASDSELSTANDKYVQPIKSHFIGNLTNLSYARHYSLQRVN